MMRSARAAVVASLSLGLAIPLATPLRAEVARSVPVLVPGLPIALGTADVWPAQQEASGAVVVLPEATEAPPGLAGELAARGHDVIAYTARPWPEPERAQRFATALGEFTQVVGRGEAAAIVLTRWDRLAFLVEALTRSPTPKVRAIVVDARRPSGRIELPSPDAIADWPPLLLIEDESDAARRGTTLRLLLAWRARGGDAQQAVSEAAGPGLAAVVDAYVRSRLIRRVPRFESALLAPDPGFERARAAGLAAGRIVGFASGPAGLRIGVDGRSARVLVADRDGFRLEADFGSQRLLFFGAALGSEASSPIVHAATLVDGRVLLRRHDPVGDLWRPVVEWSLDGAAQGLELHALAEGSLLAVVDEGMRTSAWRIDAAGARKVPPPPGRPDAMAAGHGLIAALTSEGGRQTLWLDAVGEWRAIADWPRASATPMRALRPGLAGDWLAFAPDGSNLRVDPLAGVVAELDAGTTLGTVGVASWSAPRPVVFVHPETREVLWWRAAGWNLDRAALMLWREASGRHSLSAAPDLVHLDAAYPIDGAGRPGAEFLVAGRDAAGRVRLLRGRLPRLRPPGGWWSADDPARGGVWLAFGDDEAELHRLDRGADGRARWRVARAVVEDDAVIAVVPWADPFGGDHRSTRHGPRETARRPRVDFDPERTAALCGPARAGIAAAVLDEDGDSLCLRAGRLPTTPHGRRARGLWRQAAAEWPALVGLSDAGPSSPARDAIVLLYRDGAGVARWRLGFADPTDAVGIAALSEWLGGSSPLPAGLLAYRAGSDCDDSPLLVEWRPFADVGRLPGLPRGLGARFVRADLPACY